MLSSPLDIGTDAPSTVDGERDLGRSAILVGPEVKAQEGRTLVSKFVDRFEDAADRPAGLAAGRDDGRLPHRLGEGGEYRAVHAASMDVGGTDEPDFVAAGVITVGRGDDGGLNWT
jgi:hypothetical protein